MDALDQIAGPADSLVRRVDELLSGAGAPPDHRVWTQLRRVRLLPGDAVHAVTALRSAELLDAAPELRADARAYAGIAESLPSPGGWTGAAADAYDAARRRAADHLSGGADSLDERMEATADLADALIDWIEQTRGSLAGTLAEILVSSQAITLVAEEPADPTASRLVAAAADVAERILRSVADSYDTAVELLHGSAELAVPYQV
jgi:hypothetical protein